jgi:seryl-tRNA synthetase
MNKDVAQRRSDTTDSTMDGLFDRLFQPMQADGVYARTGHYERVVEALAAAISALREDGTEVFRFPPVMSRADLERHGYLKSFPNLLGCVSCLDGGEADIRRTVDSFYEGRSAWTDGLAPADLVLTPAACYPVYPIAASRGAVPAHGLRFDVACDCFRREPSRDLDRLQSFRMREYVCIGTAEIVQAFRERWLGKATAFAESLGLPFEVAQASDPFFGRVGQIMAFRQLEQALKFELLIPLRGAGPGTACMSFNYHQSHFGETWHLKDEAGDTSHTGCVAFGMDRLTVALFATHGIETAQWPETARIVLGFGAD